MKHSATSSLRSPSSRRSKTHSAMRRPRPSRLALAMAGVSLLSLVPGVEGARAQALPGGMTVGSGQASVVTSGSRMTVTNSNNAILNWQSFSIGAGNAVRFEQQNAASQVLNRVVGNDPSSILGSLSSNGRVWLLNPNGVLFGQGARVDVGGLVASTLKLGDNDFLAGRYSFTQGDRAGSIVNQGELRTTLGGRIALIGSSAGVRNEGLIDAPGGQVLLAAGQSVDLVDTGAPNLTLRVTAPQGEALNLGTLRAAGGRIDLQAAMVNQQGIVRAESLDGGPGGEIVLRASQSLATSADSITSADGSRGGTVTLDAGDGTALAGGTVSATGSSGNGGDIKLLGRQVGVIDGARLDASGRSGGGSLLVGGGAEGKDAKVPNADAAYIAPTATLAADAGERGDGGHVVVWSNQATRAYGRFSAMGGMLGGNGGLIETSGGWLDARPASMNTTAANGKAGQWLLDPNDILITSETTNTNVSAGPNFTTTNDNAVIDADTISNALAGGNNVTITTGTAGTNSQPGDIIVRAAGISPAIGSLPVTLTLNARGGIGFLRSSISPETGTLNVNLNAGTGGATGVVQLTSTSIGVAGTVNISGTTTTLGSTSAITSSSVGNAIVIGGANGANAGGFTNTSGPGALSTPNGRWLLYETTPSAVTLGGLTYNFRQYNAQYAPRTAPALAGNGLLFSVAPTVSLAANASKVYDGTTSISLASANLTVTGGLLAGDTAQVPSTPAPTGTFADKDAGTGKALTLAANTITFRDSNNLPVVGYAFGPLTGTVTPKTLVATGVTAANKTYDGNTTATVNVASLGGLVGSEGFGSVASGSFDTKDAGTEKKVTVVYALGGGTGGALAGNYTVSGPTGATADVTPKALTLVGATAANKVYDGTTAATVSGTLGGLVGSEAFVTTTGGSFVDKDAGAGKTVNVTVALGAGSNGALAGNYAAPTGATTTASITPKALTLSGASAANKVYDGTTAASVTPGTLSGLVGNESFTPTASGSFDTKDAGTGKTVTVNVALGSGSGGALASNYTVATGATTTANITPRPLTVTGVSAADKVYDGTTAATLTSSALTGLVGGESFTSVGTGSFDTKDAGTAKTVTVTSFALGSGSNGALASNYTLSGSPTTTTASITRRALTLAGISVDTKTYDGTTAATLGGGTLSGLVGSESFTVSATGSFDTKDAGTGKAVAVSYALGSGSNGALASNYTTSGSGTARGTITPKALTLNGVTAVDKTYDGNTTAAVSGGTLSGLVGSESFGSFTLSGNFVTKDAGTGKPVAINVALGSGSNGALAGNYGSVGANTATASITPKALTLTGVTASNKVYDGNTTAAVTAGTLIGLVGSESFTTTAIGSFDTRDAGTGKTVNLQYALGGGSNGALAGNYAFATSSATTTASITPRAVNISSLVASDKVYDGTRGATVGWSLGNVVSGDQVNVATGTASFGDANVGNNKTVSGTATALGGADARNYVLAQATGSTTANITPAPLTYVAAHADGIVGTPLPALSGAVTGFVGGETRASATSGSIAFTTPATTTSSAGSYRVDGTGLSAANYFFVQAAGNATALRLAPASVAVEPIDTTSVLIASIDRVAPDFRAVPPVPDTLPDVSAGQVLDSTQAFNAGPGVQGLGFRSLSIEAMTQPDLLALLESRERFKKALFSDALSRLADDPTLADVPACDTVKQLDTGSCLITETLKRDASAARATVTDGSTAGRPLPEPLPIPTPTPTPAPTPPTPVAVAPIEPAAPVAVAPETAGVLLSPRTTVKAALPQIVRKIGVFIGIDRFTDPRIPKLDNAVGDARAVAQLFQSSLGYETVVLENATKQSIIATLNRLAAQVGPHDSVVVYYAGHGDIVPSTGLGYWQPSNADSTKPETWLSNSDIGKLLLQFGASQVALVSDSCYSGTLVAQERIRPSSTPVDPTQVLSRRSVVVMSSGGNEPVFDLGKQGHSPFAYNLMRTLQQVNSWQPGGNVFERVRFAVARELPQRPQYGASAQGGHQAGGDYLFEQRQLAP